MSRKKKHNRLEKDLEKLKKYRGAIGTLEREIRLLEAGADGLRAMSCEPCGQDREKNCADERGAACLLRIEALKEKQAEYRAYAEYYNWLLTLLPEDERMVLEMLTIDRTKGRLRRATNVLHCEVSTLYRIKARALDHLAELAAVAQGPA